MKALAFGLAGLAALAATQVMADPDEPFIYHWASTAGATTVMTREGDVLCTAHWPDKLFGLPLDFGFPANVPVIGIYRSASGPNRPAVCYTYAPVAGTKAAVESSDDIKFLEAGENTGSGDPELRFLEWQFSKGTYGDMKLPPGTLVLDLAGPKTFVICETNDGVATGFYLGSDQHAQLRCGPQDADSYRTIAYVLVGHMAPKPDAETAPAAMPAKP